MAKGKILCHCGHKLKDHYIGQITLLPRWGCNACFVELAAQTTWQHFYKPDNLKYLESLL